MLWTDWLKQTKSLLTTWLILGSIQRRVWDKDLVQIVIGKVTSEGSSEGVMRVSQGGGLAILRICQRGRQQYNSTGSLRYIYNASRGVIWRKWRLEHFFSTSVPPLVESCPRRKLSCHSSSPIQCRFIELSQHWKRPWARKWKTNTEAESGITLNCFVVAGITGELRDMSHIPAKADYKDVWGWRIDTEQSDLAQPDLKDGLGKG